MNPRTSQLRIDIMPATLNASQNWAIDVRASELYDQRMIALVAPSNSKATTKINLIDGLNIDIVDLQGNALPVGVLQTGHPCWFVYDQPSNKFELCFGGSGNYFDTVPMFTVLWWPNRATIPSGYVAGDGQLLSRSLFVGATEALVGGSMPVVTEAAWAADPLKRGSYTLGDGSNDFRVPDYNGKQVGSLGAVFLRGDGTNSAGTAGLMQGDAIRNITGTFHNWAQNGQGALAVGAFKVGVTRGSGGQAAGSASVAADFDASLVVPTAAENRPISVTGCYIIKMFGAVTNVGIADAAALATELTKFANANARLGDAGPLTWRNKVINGSMQICQHVASRVDADASGPFNICDRFRWSGAYMTTNKVDLNWFQYDGTASRPFDHCFATSKTAVALPANGQCQIYHCLEGYIARQLIGKTFTLSFMVASTVPGRYYVNFRNSNTSKSYVVPYDITTAGAWEKKTITVPAGILTGAGWDITNGYGLFVCWQLAAGSDYHTNQSGQWVDGNKLCGPDQTNLFAASGRSFALGQVQLEEGTVATPIEQRPYGAELAMCHRYYRKLSGTSTASKSIILGMGTGYGTQMIVPFVFPVPMRAAPTFTYGNLIFWIYNGSEAAVTGVNEVRPAQDACSMTVSFGGATGWGSTGGSGQVGSPLSGATAFVAFDAEL